MMISILAAAAAAANVPPPPLPLGTVCASAELAAPPRGWNSYDSSPPWTQSREASTEAATLQDADVLSAKLLPHGYDTLTLDSGWFGEDNLYGAQTIDEFGRLVPNTTQFPSSAGGAGLAPLVSEVHAKGLKMGIWIGGGVPRMAVEARSKIKGTQWTAADIAIVDGATNKDGKSTGSMDCSWNKWLLHGINHSHPGAGPYMASLADLYADEWQLDFLKIDCVFGSDWFRGSEYVPALIKALKAKKRPMTISLSPGSSVPNATLAAVARDMATALEQPLMARLTGDFWDEWGPLVDHFAYAAELTRYTTPLFSPDLDMLPMGWIAHVGTGPRFSRFTEREQRSMMTMWSMARAPLIWGGSPTLSNATTLALLTNQDVLDVQTTSCRNQLVDRPGSANTTVAWVAQSANSAGGRFVGLWNLGSAAATVAVEWEALGLDQPPAAEDVTELWAGRPLSTGQSLSAKLAPHDSVLVRIEAHVR